MEWNKGVPNEADFEEGTWIVAEIPALFNKEAKGYKVARLMGGKWTQEEVYRATQWAILELPEVENK